MLEPLRDLRRAIDRALEAIGPLEPVIEVWTSSQEDAAERAAAPARSPVAPGEPTARAQQASETAPAPAGHGNGTPVPPMPASSNGADPGKQVGSCGHCAKPLPERGRGPGPRPKYCSDACKAQAREARARAREQATAPGPAALPDRVDRPFAMVRYPDDARSDAMLLQPPPLEWELEAGAA